MASSDALPVPRKGVAYRYYFPAQKSDGTSIFTWSSAAARISKDGGADAATTNSPTEIGTTFGGGYIDLTATEMTADAVILKVTWANVGSIHFWFTLYPQEAGDIRVNPTYWADGIIPTPNVTGEPLVDVNHWRGTQPNVLISGRLDTSPGAMQAAAVQAIWDALTANLTTANSIGKLLVTQLDTNVGSRSTYAGGDTSGVTTLLSRLSAARAGYLDNLSAGAVAQSTDIATLLARLTLTRAGYLDNLSGGAVSLASDMATLLSRISALRAGYLDNLDVGGAVASQADINALNQSASRRLVLTVLNQWERPESGTTTFTILLSSYDGDGAPVNADVTPTLTATGVTSGSLAGHLSGPTNPATGLYVWTYTVQNTDAIEQVTLNASATIATVVFTIPSLTQVTDVVAQTWNSTNASQLAAVFNKLPSRAYLAGTVASTGAVDADVQVGLSAQGYSPTRAAFLDVLDGLVANVQSGLATLASITALQTHGDGAWATANLASLLTTSHFDVALATLTDHGDTEWSTADVSALLTFTGLDDTLADLSAHGDATWSTADISHLLLTTAFNTAVALLATTAQLNTATTGLHTSITGLDTHLTTVENVVNDVRDMLQGLSIGVTFIGPIVAKNGDTTITKGKTYTGAYALRYRSADTRDLTTLDVKLEFTTPRGRQYQLVATPTGSVGLWDLVVGVLDTQTLTWPEGTFLAELSVYDTGVEQEGLGKFALTIEPNP